MRNMAISIIAMMVLAACNQGGGAAAGGDSKAASGESAQTSSGGGDGKEIIIGFSAPLTGPQSHYGEDYKSGVQMAIDEANEQGSPSTVALPSSNWMRKTMARILSKPPKWLSVLST